MKFTLPLHILLKTFQMTIRLQSKPHIQTLKSLENVFFFSKRKATAEGNKRNREENTTNNNNEIESKRNDNEMVMRCIHKTHTFLGMHEKRKEMLCFLLSVFQLNWFRYCHFAVFVFVYFVVAVFSNISTHCNCT